MDILNTIITVLAGLLMLTVLVVMHEYGHFSVGRACDIRIEEFGVGFGPKLFSRVKKGIRYSIRAFPLGGFVQFYGEDDEVDAKEEPRAFNNRPIWQRFLTILAGPLSNLAMALVVTVFILSLFGDYAPQIAAVTPGSSAEEAGVLPGDV
ncbi:MAG: site-2 protease family protein, partial [Christensenellaceae bacterium]|nr:site-2 protease family protein [Christensenellaceae bacterium]